MAHAVVYESCCGLHATVCLAAYNSLPVLTTTHRGPGSTQAPPNPANPNPVGHKEATTAPQ
jgi:hypothetical protein